MAKLLIEMYKNWVLIETIPITRKTDVEISNRIPKTRLWRVNYLSHIIKAPQMSLNDWANIPSVTVTIIYDCIRDLLNEYERENIVLDLIIEDIHNENYSDDSLDEIVKNRDLFLKKVAEKEGNQKIFRYSKEKIASLSKMN